MRRTAFLTALAVVAFMATFLATRMARPGGRLDSATRARAVERPVPPTAATDPPGDKPPGMAWVPGGEFTDGLRRPAGRPRRAPGPPGARRRLLDGRDRGHQRPVPQVRRGDRLRDHGRAAGRLGAAQERAAAGHAEAPGRPSRPRLARLLRRPTSRSRSTIRRRGGAGSPARAGGTPRGRAARSRARTTTRSSTSPGTTPSPTRNGPASGSRPRPSGSSPPAAASKAASMPGATSSSPATSRSRTPGRATSRTRTPGPTASPGRPRSSRSRPTGTACTT